MAAPALPTLRELLEASDDDIDVYAADDDDVDEKQQQADDGSDDDDDDAASGDASLRNCEAREATMRAAFRLLRACKFQLGQGDAAAARGPEERLALEPRWQRHYEWLSAVPSVGAHFGLAPADVCFKAICHSWLCERRAAYAASSLQHLAHAHAELVVLSCQHTEEARSCWPSAEEWLRLKDRIACVVVDLLECEADERQMLVDQLSDDTRQHFEALPPELSRAYEARRMPPLLAHELEARRRKAEEDRARGRTKDIVDGTSEEAQGALWRNTAAELVDNFLYLSSRVWREVERQNALAARFPVEEAPRLNEQTLERMRKWVRDKCAIEQTEGLTELFRRLANESFWPLGTATRRYREARNRYDETDALTLLNEEVGVDLGQHLHDLSLRRLSEHAAAAAAHSLFWDALFLALFATTLMQRAQLDWLREYFCAQPFSRAWRRRLVQRHYRGALKCPVVLPLQRRFFVFHQERLLLCSSLLQAVGVWLYLVREEFAGVLENTEDLAATGILATFLPEHCLQA